MSVSIGFKDFLPPVANKGGLLTAPSLGAVEYAVNDANAWIRAIDADVLGVETLLLPWIGGDASTSAGGMETFEGGRAIKYQVVRVWYRIRSA